MNCEKCPYNGQSKIKPVLQENSAVFFIGSGPSIEEIRYGYPFCPTGQSGKLLVECFVNFFKAGIKYSASHCIKCLRPPEKKTSVRAINACAEGIQEEIRIVKPQLIVAFGQGAMTALTGMTTGIKEYNGQILYEEIPILICYSPNWVFKGGNEHERKLLFEKGIAPAVAFFKPLQPLPYEIRDTIEPVEQEVGFDIETTDLNPHFGDIRCFSVSDGKKAIFVSLRDENDKEEV